MTALYSATNSLPNTYTNTHINNLFVPGNCPSDNRQTNTNKLSLHASNTEAM